MDPGTCLRQVREQLGLTYRDVEQPSYELASRRRRPDFILRISRLADIENGGVTPSLYKLYSLCSIYHLDIFEVSAWYGVALDELRNDAMEHAAPKTHPFASRRPTPPPALRRCLIDSRRTDFLAFPKQDLGPLGAALLDGHPRYRLGFVGTEDHWMEPLIRPGAVVLLDPARRHIENSGWCNEFNRPIYFIELHDGYRCCWCSHERGRLILQPHPLSPCTPEIVRVPEEAEVVGRVVGMAMRLVAA